MFTTTIKTLLCLFDDDDEEVMSIAKRHPTLDSFTAYCNIVALKGCKNNYVKQTKYILDIIFRKVFDDVSTTRIS